MIFIFMCTNVSKKLKEYFLDIYVQICSVTPRICIESFTVLHPPSVVDVGRIDMLLSDLNVMTTSFRPNLPLICMTYVVYFQFFRKVCLRTSRQLR